MIKDVTKEYMGVGLYIQNHEKNSKCVKKACKLIVPFDTFIL